MGLRNTNHLSIHNYEREHGGINGMTQSEKFMNIKTTDINTLEQNKKCQPCWYIVLSTMCGSTTINDKTVVVNSGVNTSVMLNVKYL